MSRGKRPSYFFSEFQLFGRYSGAMTVIGGFCLFGCGLLLLLIARHYRAARRKGAFGWLISGLGFMFLAVDEVMMIHEKLAWKVAVLGAPELFGFLAPDFYIFLGYWIFAVIIVFYLLPAIKLHSNCLFFLFASFVFFFCSQVVDFIPWDNLTQQQQDVLAPLEEILKTLGSWFALLYGVLLLEEVSFVSLRD